MIIKIIPRNIKYELKGRGLHKVPELLKKFPEFDAKSKETCNINIVKLIAFSLPSLLNCWEIPFKRGA